jgi:predicted kinase
MRREFARLRATFAARKADGFVRECHGDLHLGNMFLRDDRVEVFDCIEFNDRFRWIDVQSEIAFAVMDLADRGRADYSRRFLNAYLERTGDYDGLSVLPFYLIYRAAVRAKVACLRLAQADVADRERQELGCELGEYLQLADRYAKSRQPSIVITHGFSGSGKSTVAQAILEALGAVRIRSDVERKRLFGQYSSTRNGGGLEHGIYAADATEQTYARLAELAAKIVAAGFPAIVDATFLMRRDREAFRDLSCRLNVPFAILDLYADEATLRRRVSERIRAGTDASDADLRVLDSQFARHEPLGDDELLQTVAVDSGANDSIERALRQLEALGVKGDGERLVAPGTASGRGAPPET